MLSDRDARAALVAAFGAASYQPTLGDLQGSQAIWRLDGYPAFPSAEWGATALLTSLYSSAEIETALVNADATEIALALSHQGRITEPPALYADKLAGAAAELAGVLGEHAVIVGPDSPPSVAPGWPPAAPGRAPAATDPRSQASSDALTAGLVLGGIATWILFRAIGGSGA